MSVDDVVNNSSWGDLDGCWYWSAHRNPLLFALHRLQNSEVD